MKEFKNQNYEQLLKTQLEYGVPFTDPLFPPNDSSLFFSNRERGRMNVVWKRPGVSCLFCIFRNISFNKIVVLFLKILSGTM